MPGYTEITVVCTHPSRRGEGLGEDVVNAVSRRIRARGDIPFLHVFSNNAPAIALYRRLGFTLRRQLQLTIMSPSDNCISMALLEHVPPDWTQSGGRSCSRIH